jgi:hypothetical protein
MIHLIYLTYIKEITPLKFLRNIDTNTELKGKGERKGEGNQQFLVSPSGIQQWSEWRL